MKNAPTATVAAPAPAVKAPSATAAIIIASKHLEWFNALKEEFHGPGATVSTALTSVEAFELLMEVATDRRFASIQAHDEETGEALFDSDGVPEMKTLDLFEKASEKIFKARAATKNKSKIEKLKEKMAALGVDVSKL